MSWYAVATKSGFKVSHRARVSGGRYAFGPYSRKSKACQVAQYQGHGAVPHGCEPASRFSGGFLEKLFGKKKPKRNPMSRRMYFVPGAGKNPMARRGELVTMGRARRKRRRRR